MKSPQVYKYMTPSPHSIGRQQTLATAHRMMRDNHIRHLPVLDAGVLVGLVSERDLTFNETLRGVDPSTETVEDAMTPEPYEHKYGSAIVVDQGNVVGIFTTIDALRAFIDVEHRAATHESRP